MKLGVPKESRQGERRVALVPESAKRLIAKGVAVSIETGAGAEAGFLDENYEAVGATIAASGAALRGEADLVVQINPPTLAEVAALKKGAASISLVFPLVAHDLVRAFAAAGVSAISLDRIPRTTLAQAMDVLSSQATVAGYKAVLVAADRLPKLFPLMMTAAGRIEPARVMILGAGVAGLTAIGVARRLGAVVEAYDVRAVVKEQVESLGASFIDIGVAANAETAGGYATEVGEDVRKRANEVIGDHLANTDVCITTALIPGRPAPRLVTAEMLARMPEGAVVVDLAAEQGGNVEGTVAGSSVKIGGATVVGPTNLPGDVPFHASQMFSRNCEKLIIYMLKDGELDFDFDKEIVRGATVTFQGKVVDTQVAEAIGA
jgi:NAD(P) transhydrogenase subunit alpha